VEGEEYTSLFFAHPIFLKPSKLASHSKGEGAKAHSVRAIRIGASEILLVKQEMVVRVDEIPMSQSHRVFARLAHNSASTAISGEPWISFNASPLIESRVADMCMRV